MTKEKLNQIDSTNYSTQFNNNQSQGSRGLPVNNIASKQLCSPSNSESAQFNEKKERQIFGDISRNKQFSSNSDQMQLNGKQESSSQGNGGLIAGHRGSQEELNNSNPVQEQHSTKSNINVEKDKLIEFLKQLGYFPSTHTKINKDVEQLYLTSLTLLKQIKQLDEKEFANKLQQQDAYFLISLHYYFELFLQYLLNQEFKSITEFINSNKNKGRITTQYFQYLLSKKELIETNLPQKTWNNNPHITSNEEEYVWEMYKGYCEIYTSKKY